MTEDHRIALIQKLQELKSQYGKPAPFNKGDGDQRWEQKKKKEAFDLVNQLISEHLGDDWIERPDVLILILEFGRGIKQYEQILKLS